MKKMINHIIKYIKKRKRKFEIEIILFYLIFGFFGIIGGLWVFLIGFHNIDLGSNFIRVSLILEENNIFLKDKALDGNSYTLEELYGIGVKQLFISIPLILISTLFFASSLNELLRYTNYYAR